MPKSLNSAYNTAVFLLNKPFQDMRGTPRDTVIKAVNNAAAAVAAQGQPLTEADCDTLLTELLAAQQQAQSSGSGAFAATKWQWPEKPEPAETIRNPHFVTEE